MARVRTKTKRRSAVRTERSDDLPADPGVRVIKLQAGDLKLSLCPTRGMSILRASCGSVQAGWRSPVGRIVHPAAIDLSRDGGTGWLQGFNEFVVRCGLRSLGRPGWDRELGRGPREFLTLHGRAANLEAQQVRARRRAASGVVIDPPLALKTTVSLDSGRPTFVLTDTVTNTGLVPAEFQLMYHNNLGAPLLGEGARFLGSVAAIAGIDGHSWAQVKSWDRYGGPTPGFRECVFLLRPRADRHGRAQVALENAAGVAAESIVFNVKEMPCLTLWKQTGTHAERYVTGLEPGTSFPFHRAFERRHDRVPMLAPGQTRRFRLQYQFHVGREAVATLRDGIIARQGGAKPEISGLARFMARFRRWAATEAYA